MSYLWHVALDCPHQQIADLARQRLVWLHVHLAPELQPRCVTVRTSFITCAPAAKNPWHSCHWHPCDAVAASKQG